MKLESLPDLYFVVSVFVPGFIFRGVLSGFVPLREHRAKEFVVLGLLTATAFNYAFCSPLIYLLVTGELFPESAAWQAMTWLAIIFVVPILLALVWAGVRQQDGLARLFRGMKLRPINPIPTGWDWIFSRTDP